MLANEESPHFIQLDGIRALAVAAVLFQHYWLDRTLFFGNLGVQCFFVLSGYLITGILLRSRAAVEQGAYLTFVALGRFYARRFLRIFPVYYLVLGLAALLNIETNRDALKWHASYLTSVYLALDPVQNTTSLGHFWSLSVEEQFYLIWPCWILLAPRKWILPGVLAVITLSPSYKLLAGVAGVNFNARVLTIIGNTESLGMGALLALVQSGQFANERARKGLRTFCLCFGALLLAPSLKIVMDIYPHYNRLWVYGNLGMALLFSWVVTGAAQGLPGLAGRILMLEPMTYVGKISYGIYLMHLPIRDLCLHWLPPDSILSKSGPLHFLAFSLVTIAAASLSWHFYEKPINQLKRHFPYGNRRGDSPRL